MTNKFNIGDRVFVPSRILPRPDHQPHALAEAKVLGQRDRTVRIDRQDAAGNDIEVASRLVHGDNLGITILEIGDFATEVTTLDPLTKSVLQYLRLLIDDGMLRKYKVRTTSELSRVWADVEPVTSHVLIIGHGVADSIRFIDRSKPVRGNQLAKLLQNASASSRPKIFISLSCLTGRRPFANPFSSNDVCSDYIAPFQSIHSAAASLYAQSFFSHHLLSGEGVASSHKKAKAAVGDGVSFRRWRKGSMVR